MSLSSDELIYLMAYVDGQVDDDEIAEVEALIARSEEARGVVANLSAVGSWMRASSDERAVLAGADRIAGRVMTEAETLGGAKVILLERERAHRALNRQRVKEFGALAAFAAALLLLWSWPARTERPGAVAKAPVMVLPPRAPASGTPAADSDTSGSPALAVGSEEGVDVENVESPHNVSVFYLPVANKNAASVVVWIGEEESH